jgi:uncharacterized OB-fold protein
MSDRKEGYDEWLDALRDGDGHALVCPEGHGSLPPRRVCPACGATTLSREPLPETGTLKTFSVVHVPAPSFAGDAPYVTAIASFGPVRLTGVLRGVDPGTVGGGENGRLDDGADVDVGTRVSVDVETRDGTPDRVVVFQLIEEDAE